MKLHELLEQRAALISKMRGISDAAEGESRDLSEIETRDFNESKTAVSALDARISRQQALDAMERQAPAVISAENRGDGSYEERARRFSLQTAIRNALPRDVGGGGVDAGLEVEISAEVAKRAGRQLEGIPIPREVFEVEKRVLLAGSSAADLIPNVHRPDLFIDRLRSAIVVERLGATVLDGLQGTVDIPKQTSSSTAEWLEEDEALSGSDAGFADVTLSPHTVGALTSYSRRTLLNASPSIEQILRNDLAKVLANAIDAAALTGSGTNGVPQGVVGHGDVVEFEIASPSNGVLTWADVLAIVARVEGEDAAFGGPAWVLNPHVKKRLRAIPKISGDGSQGFLMDSPSELAGYRAATTTAMPGSEGGFDGKLIYGDFSQILIGRYDALSLLLNPYADSYYSRGRVGIRALQDIDIQLRHGESFTYVEDLAA